MAIKVLPAVNIAMGKWNYIAFEGDAGWFNQNGNTTQVDKVEGTNCKWHGKVLTTIGTTILVVGVKSKGVMTEDTPTDGQVTVTLTDVSTQPPPTTVQYTDTTQPEPPV